MSTFDLNTFILNTIQHNPQLIVNMFIGLFMAVCLIPFAKFALGWLWQQLATNILRFLGYLGSFKGLSRLALWTYRRNLIKNYGMLVNIYLGKEEELSLKQVFVPLTLRATGITTLTENCTTEQILTDSEQKRLVLLGAPGSGKSTLLKALVAGISRREWPQFNNLEPVLVSLREYAHVVDIKSLLDWLTEDELPRLGLRNPKPLLKFLLARGRVLLMLDGLDEVANDQINAVNIAISSFLYEFDKPYDSDRPVRCRVLLTCREQNYDDLPDRQHYTRVGFTEYRVAELRDSEIRAIVRRREDSFTDKQKSMTNYLGQVFRHSDILQLHRNPLLLTLSMGVYLHKPGEELPHNLAQFYEQAIDNLLRRHDFREVIGGRSANHFKAEDKFRLLRHFALNNLIEASTAGRDFETFEFLAVTQAARQLAEQGKVSFKPDDALAVVKEIQLQAGILNALLDGECFLFAHRSLNEYCAAAALNRQNQAGFEIMLTELHNTAWRQVIFFYAAIDDDNDNAVRLVEAIQQRATEKNDLHLLALAGHSAAVMVQPRPQLRLVLLELLAEQLLAADDLAMRGVLLKSLLALGNSREESIRLRLDDVLRQFVELGLADALINEVKRLEPDVALQFLTYLSDNEDLKRKKITLKALWHFEGQDKIPLLWRLLLFFRAGNDAESVRNALAQLLNLMDEADAVERLNDCEPKLLNTDPAEQQQLFKVYPFQSPSQPITHFVRLLTWATESPLFAPRNDVAGGTDWQQFLDLILMNKSDEEQREWQRLPRDKNKWTWKVQTVVLGRLLFGLPLLLGYLLILLMLCLDTISVFEKSIFLSTGVIFTMFFGVLVSIFWLTWKDTILRWGKFGSLSVFPTCLSRKDWVYMICIIGFTMPLFLVTNFLHNSSFSGHTQKITCLATTTATPLLITGSYDNTARLWDIKTGAELHSFIHDDQVTAVAVSLDGSTVLTASFDGTARLWNSKTGIELRRFQHNGGVKAVTFSPDGSIVLTASWDGTVRLWDNKTGIELLQFKQYGLTAVAFSPDGSTVQTTSWDGTVQLWDSKTGNEVQRFKHDKIDRIMTYSPDGIVKLTAWGNTALLWNKKTGKDLRFKQDNEVTAVAFTPNEQGIYTGSSDGVVRLWNIQSGELLWESPRPFWNLSTWNWRIVSIWLALVFLVFFLPCLNWFDRGRVLYLRKPNRYIHLYSIPGVERWLPQEEKE